MARYTTDPASSINYVPIFLLFFFYFRLVLEPKCPEREGGTYDEDNNDSHKNSLIGVPVHLEFCEVTRFARVTIIAHSVVASFCPRLALPVLGIKPRFWNFPVGIIPLKESTPCWWPAAAQLFKDIENVRCKNSQFSATASQQDARKLIDKCSIR